MNYTGKNRNNNKYVILLVFTLIFVSISTTLSYLSLVKSQEEEGTKLYTGKLEINYLDGVYIKNPELLPRSDTPLYDTMDNVYRNSFIVSSSGTLNQTISIDLETTKNDFPDNVIKYIIFNANGEKMAQGGVKNRLGKINLVDNLYLAYDGQAKYTLILWYNNTNYDQRKEAGYALCGRIKVYSKQVKYQKESDFMFKSPIKQIYLLLIVIVGIISLSVYSTYALFIYEKETGEVVNINTLDYLQVGANIKEYKRALVKGNSLTFIDVDISNPSDSLMCYGLWYQVVSNNEDVHAYKSSIDSVTSGSLEGLGSRRVSIVIFNDNKDDVSVNVGVNGSSDLSCNLNLDDDKYLITDVYNVTYLNEYLLGSVSDKEIERASEYKEIEDYFIEKDMDKLLVSSKFEFDNGIFTLLDSYEINVSDIKEDELYYFILDDNNHEMYKITSMDDNYINTTRYIGFVESINGIVKYLDNYEYYGANPQNYICFNEKDNQCELYRIVGLFKDDNKYNVKIVRNDYTGIERYSINDNNLFVLGY